MSRIRNSIQQQKPRGTHSAAEALDWDEAMELISLLIEDEFYRDALLVACGCFLGLRISDILRLRWEHLMPSDGILTLTEKKTGKTRRMQINHTLSEITAECYDASGRPSQDEYIFTGQKNGYRIPITRQRANQILKEAQRRYDIKSASVFSSHTLRKTFGRRVWLQQCDRGRGELALQLLSEIFGHSSIQITKRYLGIRQDELLSVYSSLTD